MKDLRRLVFYSILVRVLCHVALVLSIFEKTVKMIANYFAKQVYRRKLENAQLGLEILNEEWDKFMKKDLLKNNNGLGNEINVCDIDEITVKVFEILKIMDKLSQVSDGTENNAEENFEKESRLSSSSIHTLKSNALDSSKNGALLDEVEVLQNEELDRGSRPLKEKNSAISNYKSGNCKNDNNDDNGINKFNYFDNYSTTCDSVSWSDKTYESEIKDPVLDSTCRLVLKKLSTNNVQIMYYNDFKLNVKYDVMVPFFKNPSEFYVQIVDDVFKFINCLINEMKSEYESCTSVFKSKTDIKNSNEHFFAWYDSKSKIWMRVEITDFCEHKKNCNELVRIFAIDFGYDKKANISNLQILNPNFYQYPRFAIRCFTRDVVSFNFERNQNYWPPEVSKHVKKLIDENYRSCSAIFLNEAKKDVYGVALKMGDQYLDEYLIQNKIAQRTSMTSQQKIIQIK